MVKLLLQADADADVQRDSDGASALHLATEAGYGKVARCLLTASNAPADMNLRDKRGVSALELAKGKPESGVLRILLKARTDVFQCTHRHSRCSQQERARWLGKRAIESMRASAAPANAPPPEDGVELPPTLQEYEVPAGVADAAVMSLFDTDEMRALAAQLGFRIPGLGQADCTTDVANLVLAMRGAPPAGEISESDVVHAIEEVRGKIGRQDFSRLWLPTHMVHDCETDDLLAWLLLTSIHRAIGSTLKTLVQLPPLEDDDDIGRIARKLNRAMPVDCDCQVFFDPSARNHDAIKTAFGS